MVRLMMLNSAIHMHCQHCHMTIWPMLELSKDEVVEDEIDKSATDDESGNESEGDEVDDGHGKSVIHV